MFAHEQSVADIAFDSKGRRLAAATYGGAALWYARIADQKPVFLKWAGQPYAAVFSPDGRFLMSAMQDTQLHGWRLADAKDMRMGGYPAKVKAMGSWPSGVLLATSGRARGGGVALRRGRTGRWARRRPRSAFDESQPGRPRGRRAGRTCWPRASRTAGCSAWRPTSRRLEPIKADKGAPITALALSADGARLAWGDEDGGGGRVHASVPGLTWSSLRRTRNAR